MTDSCDFQLGLWDALTSGTQVGSTLTWTSVAVSEGLFTVQLDFGVNAFNGNARWLETAVRCPSGGGVYNTLSPRQPLTPAPYSLYSANADLLDGLHSAAFQQHAHNLVVVAKSGGDFTTITDALNSITDNSADNPYLIYVAPGIYTERVIMKPYVDIEGAGEQATKITYLGNSDHHIGTVAGADHAEIRFLSVENTGNDSYAIGIINMSGSPHLTHLTVISTGAISGLPYNVGVYNIGSSPVMLDMNIIAAGNATGNVGVLNNSASPTMENVNAIASGGTSSNYGVNNYSSSPSMTNVNASASGGTYTYGVYNEYSSPIIENLTASASGGTNGYGMWNKDSSPTIQNSVLYGGGSYTGDGIHNNANGDGPYILEINNSQISGGSSTIYSDSSKYTTRVGASKLVGNGGMGPGNYICVASYTGDYTPLNSTCQP